MRKGAFTFIGRYGDGVLAVALSAAVVVVDVVLREASTGSKISVAAAVVVIGVAAAHRVRAPLVFLGLLLAVTVAAVALDVGPSLYGTPTSAGILVFLLLAVYSAAVHTSGRETLLAGALTAGFYLIDLVVVDPAGINPEGVVFYALLYGAPWAAGRAIRRRRLNERQLQHEKAQAASAIVEERARIARELHDVVAHAISVMVLQARGGRRILESEPAEARNAFSVIEDTGQVALDEMRRLLGMLRRSGEELALAPQPSLKELGNLVAQVQAAGLPVQVTIEGEPRALPPGVDLSAFRIVQEALTNALRHAGPARARVLIRYDAGDLELEITDDGHGSVDGSGSGYGLIGMRERVSVYGGELQAGPRREGGYALRVRLPLRSTRA